MLKIELDPSQKKKKKKGDMLKPKSYSISSLYGAGM